MIVKPSRYVMNWWFGKQMQENKISVKISSRKLNEFSTLQLWLTDGRCISMTTFGTVMTRHYNELIVSSHRCVN